MIPEDAPLWGWKEPTSHIFLSQMQTHFGDRLHYVHVIRNGVYMAHSKNQNQVSRWGQRFGIEAEIDTFADVRHSIIGSDRTSAPSSGRSDGSRPFFLVNHDSSANLPANE